MKALRKNLQLSLALLLSLYAPLSLATLTDDLQLVGEARLRVLFWSIYDSWLFTITGRYFGVEPKLTMRINYIRKIKSGQLLDRTSEEWEKNSIIEQDIETWLEKLASILPDVKKGETLTLQVEDNLSSSFYLNDELIDNIEDAAFTQAFLSIWLSDKSSYPKQQAQLVGLRN